MEVEKDMDYFDFLKKEEIGSAYLFSGQEEYLMMDLLNKIKKRYINNEFDSLNYSQLEEKNYNFHSFRNACETLPFMSSKKILLIKDAYNFTDREKATSEDSFYDYLDSLGDHSIVIFMDINSNIKKSSKFYRYFKDEKLIVNFDKLRANQLRDWINIFFRKHNKKINSSNISYLIDRSSYLSKNANINLYALENTLTKLLNFSSDKEITREIIDSLLVESVDTNIFNLLNALNRFDLDRALYELKEMYLVNEPVARILYMIVRRIRLILSYKLYDNKGYSLAEIGDKMQIKEYEFKLIGKQIEKFSYEELVNIMNMLLEVDKKIKTKSINDKLLLESLIVELCTL